MKSVSLTCCKFPQHSMTVQRVTDGVICRMKTPRGRDIVVRQAVLSHEDVRALKQYLQRGLTKTSKELIVLCGGQPDHLVCRRKVRWGTSSYRFNLAGHCVVLDEENACTLLDHLPQHPDEVARYPSFGL